MRLVSTLVLPDPAPARMTNGAASDVTACRCAAFSPSKRARSGAAVSIAATLTNTCDSGAVIDVEPEKFEELVAAALDGIPPAIGRLIDNVALFVEDVGYDCNILGLYQGIPLTHREQYGLGGGMPDRITIYRLPILERCATEDDVIEAVRVTVVHEVGHHFGLSDHRLHELGYG
jgi:predicted Zn-dependent protease with MMP-like domain